MNICDIFIANIGKKEMREAHRPQFDLRDLPGGSDIDLPQGLFPTSDGIVSEGTVSLIHNAKVRYFHSS
jgi:hypothetical protein